jgi:hypothetical protein
VPMPSKGVRVQCTSRIPADVHRAAVREARNRGWSLNDYLVSSLRAAIGEDNLPEPVGLRQNVRIYDDAGNPIGVL